MSILVDRNTKVLVQGLTGREGSFHAERCMEYGTKIVAGVTPGRGGTVWNEKVPVFNSVEQAVKDTGANTSLIFVPPALAADAIVEAADSGVGLVIAITEGIPVMDMVKVDNYLKGKPVRLLGPNCPGVITPGARCKVGIMPAAIHKPGRVGVVSRSGTLTYEAVGQLSALDIGQSTCVGIGGDPIKGTGFIDALELFNEDDETDAVVLIGEIGGSGEQDAARYIKRNFKKPVAFLIVGQAAPPGRRMGHAGAIITGKDATAAAKIEALQDAGARLIPTPADIGATMQRLLQERRSLGRALSGGRAKAGAPGRRPAAKGAATRGASPASRRVVTTTKRSASATGKRPAAKRPTSRSMQTRRTPARREGARMTGRQ